MSRSGDGCGHLGEKARIPRAMHRDEWSIRHKHGGQVRFGGFSPKAYADLWPGFFTRNRVRYIMNPEDTTDYFVILEEKVESLIKYLHTLKKENNALSMKVESISKELEQLSKARDKAKNRMVALLEKIDQLNV